MPWSSTLFKYVEIFRHHEEGNLRNFRKNTKNGVEATVKDWKNGFQNTRGLTVQRWAILDGESPIIIKTME